MPLSNAEKQADWRARREMRLKALEKRVAELEAEVKRLRNQSDSWFRKTFAAGISTKVNARWLRPNSRT